MRILVAISFSLAASVASAQDFDLAVAATQANFASVSKDIIAVTSYKALGPAEAGGVTGFSFGAYGAYSSTLKPGAWQNVTGSKVDAIGVAGISARKGLPFGIDLGAIYARVPSTNAAIYGGSVQWAALSGGAISPAVALRGSYVKLVNGDDIEADSKTLDVSVSKGFLFFTPYTGVGYVWGTVTPDHPTLNKEKVEDARYFAGVRLSLGLMEITPEYERLGDSNLYNLRLSLGF